MAVMVGMTTKEKKAALQLMEMLPPLSFTAKDISGRLGDDFSFKLDTSFGTERA